MSESSPPLNGDGSEAALSERQFASAFGHAAIGMALCAPNGRFIKVNEALCQMLGYSEPELLCRTFQELTHPDDLDDQGRVRRLLAGEFPSFHMEKRYLHRLGHTVWVLLTVSSMRDAANQPLHQIAQLQDITERKTNEAEIARLSRLYSALSHINQAIVRTDGRDALFQSVCDSLVTQAGFSMAWIGWFDAPSQTLSPLAASGDTAGEIMVSRVSPDDDPASFGPTATAFCTGQVYICKDIQADPRTLPWRDRCERLGLHACAAFPLRMEGIVSGTLSVYADQADILQDKEIALLHEVVEDVSFALNSLERMAGRQKADEQRIASEANLAAAQALAHMGSWDLDLVTMTGTYSAEMFRLFYRDPALGAPAFADFSVLVHPDDHHLIEQAMASTAQATQPYTLEYRTHPSHGPVRCLRATIHVIRDASGQPIRTQGTTQDVTEQKQALAATERALQRLTEAQRIGQIGDWEWEIANQSITWSAQMFTILGRDPALGPPKSYAEAVAMYAPASRAVMEEKVALAIESGQAQDYELVRVRPDGEHAYVLAMAVPRKDAGGKVIGLYGTLQDVTERKYAQMALQTSLQEKEALLKEVHHRVKNNLQVINSLLRLETGRSTQPDTRTVLRDMQGRIQAMALLHESLYRTGIFASVDLGAYLKQMVGQIFRTMVPSNGVPVQLELALESLQVGMDQAMPCALLVNELISNCFKHAFPSGQGGTVRVELKALPGAGQARLCVSDTGIGLPADFEERRARSLGLQLVSDIAHQLKGILQVGPGPAFVVSFALDSPSGEI